MTETLPPTDRSRLRRMHDLGSFDVATIHAILDAQPLCTVAYVRNGKPYLTPTLQWREGDRVYWHGSSASHALRAGKGQDVCMNVTILDGFVLARSGFNHSVNTRSVTLFGIAEVVPEDEKAAHLTAMIEGLWPGRSALLRPMLPQEVKATTILSLPITEGSAKMRSGPPVDEPDDYDLPIWAGVLPASVSLGATIPDPRIKDGVDTPDHVKGVARLAGQA
jgi:nitroimidazol reductase NimA-like FMN-containing flavoprotein (pyridoxamine 5'-phosphate oxidase superfamily)